MSHVTTNTTNTEIKRKYPVPPRCRTLLPIECNPMHTSEALLVTDALAWSYNTSQFTKAQFGRIEGTAMFTAYLFPFTQDRIKYDALVKILTHYFISDDHDETFYGHIVRDVDRSALIYGQLHDVCNKLENSASGRHVSAIGWKPYILAAYAIYDEIYSSLNEVQKKRFLHVSREWIDGMIRECVDLNAKRKFNNLNEYIEVRGKSIATMALMHLVEYANSLFVPESEWTHPTLQALFAHLNRALIICNDMYSLEKELMDAGNRPDGVYNIVVTYADIECISLMESMDRLVTEMERAEKKALIVLSEIEAADWASADTRLFAKRCQYIVSGHWKVATFLDRYNELLTLEPFI